MELNKRNGIETTEWNGINGIRNSILELNIPNGGYSIPKSIQFEFSALRMSQKQNVGPYGSSGAI